MKGKILFAMVALGASSIALANGGLAPVAVTPDYFEGFYVGLEGDVQHLSGTAQDSLEYDGYTVYEPEEINHSTIINSYDFASINPTFLKADVGDTTLGGGLFAGYGKTFDSNFYLGGEVYARYAHNTIHLQTTQDSNFYYEEHKDHNGKGNGQEQHDVDGTVRTTTSMDIDSDWAFGGALKLGYLVTPKTLIYLLAGVEYSKFQVDVNHGGTGIVLFDSLKLNPINVTDSYSFDENKVAFVPGVGIETMLSDKLSLKAQYTYADFGEFTHNHDGYAVYETGYKQMDANVKIHSEDKVDLQRGLFSLGLAYHFNGI